LPGGDFGAIDIHHDHAVLRAFPGDHGHGGPAHVTGSDAENVGHAAPPFSGDGRKGQKVQN
jgi:hypothetical protein